jgi:hypothetical protein
MKPYMNLGIGSVITFCVSTLIAFQGVGQTKEVRNQANFVATAGMLIGGIQLTSFGYLASKDLKSQKK